MRKLFFLFAFLIIIQTALVSAADFAYIVKSSLGVDNYLIDEIENLNYTVDIIYESQVPSTNFSNYRIIIVGDQNLDSPKNIPVYLHRSLIINSYDYYKKSIIDYQLGWSVSSGLKSSPTSLEIVNANSNSPIVNDLPFNFRAYTVSVANTKTAYLKGQKPSGVKSIVASQNLNSDVVIATAEPGLRFLNGNVAKQRNVFFGITEARYWTIESRKLFKNSIQWLLVGEDRDKDGFFSDVDCDDTDSQSYPGAVEIPYDGIDQDCNGKDLDDVDLDGFSSVLAGGLDCNDEDASINPNNPDRLYNCMNDAPVISFIPRLLFKEGDVVTITINAIDYEDDSLSYEINDTRFIADENLLNVFRWIPGFEDSGDYIVSVSADDGEFKTALDVSFTIRNTNRAPKFNTIPELSWNEDSNYTLNLSEYFYDEDLDSLIYGIENTSSDTHISIYSFAQGIITFISNQNWFGSDWITFWAFDGRDKTISNVINLSVNSVNDFPIFISNIENKTWDEDTIATINLNSYFEDVDSVLAYEVSGNSNITISINNGIASLSSPKDWYGKEEVVFSATDGEFTINSNPIILTIIEKDELPEFVNFSCQSEINEDEEHNCVLEATDFENDDIVFSIGDEDKLKCTMQNSTLYYISNNNYFGNASCELIATDNDGSTSFLFNVNILPINDAPVITSYSPQNNAIIPEGKSRLFSIQATDIESKPKIEWLFENQVVGSGSSYSFNKPVGSYILTAQVSDSQYNVYKLWNIVVTETSQFTCSEVSGYACSETQICPSSNISVSDTALCCSVPCASKPPEFKGIDQCESINDAIKLNLKSPDKSDELLIGEKFSVEVEIQNNLNEDQKFDVDATLYDLDEESSIEESSADIEISRGRKKTAKLDLKIPDDVEDNDYLLFIKVEDNVCSQLYQDVKIERKDHLLDIDSFSVTEEAICGDVANARIKIKNLGTSDEEASIKILNNELGFQQEIPSFEIEEYGDKDTITNEISFPITEAMKPGNYTIQAIVSSYDTLTETAVLKIGECIKEEIIDSDEEIIKLNSIARATIAERSNELSIGIIIMAMLVVVAIIIMLILFARR